MDKERDNKRSLSEVEEVKYENCPSCFIVDNKSSNRKKKKRRQNIIIENITKDKSNVASRSASNFISFFSPSTLKESIEYRTFTRHHSGESLKVKHKFSVGEVAWVLWKQKYSIVFVNFLSQRMLSQKEINEREHKKREEKKKNQENDEFDTKVEADVDMFQEECCSGSVVHEANFNNYCKTGKQVNIEKNIRKTVLIKEEQLNKCKENVAKEQEENNTFKNYDFIQYVPIYWITFPCYSFRVAQEYQCWVDEIFLIKADDYGCDKCERHNETQHAKEIMLKKKENQKAMKTNLEEEKETQKEKYKVQQGEKDKEEKKVEENNMIIKFSRLSKADAKLIENEKEDNKYWFFFPNKLKIFLEKEKLLIFQKKFLVPLPKEKNKNVDFIVNDFKSIIFNTYNKIKQNYSRCAFGLYTPQDFELMYIKQLYWIDLFVTVFNLHFDGRGLYAVREEIEQFKGLKNDYEGMNLSQLLGIEHLVRFLDVRVLGSNFLSKMKIKNEEILNGCKNIINIFISFISSKFEYYTDDHQSY